MTGLHLHSARTDQKDQKDQTDQKADPMEDLKAQRKAPSQQEQQKPRFPEPELQALPSRQPDPETSVQSEAGPARPRGRNRGGVCVQLS